MLTSSSPYFNTWRLRRNCWNHRYDIASTSNNSMTAISLLVTDTEDMRTVLFQRADAKTGSR